MWLKASTSQRLHVARTGKHPHWTIQFPHYLAISEIPMESTHHPNSAESPGKQQEAIYFWGLKDLLILYNEYWYTLPIHTVTIINKLNLNK